MLADAYVLAEDLVGRVLRMFQKLFKRPIPELEQFQERVRVSRGVVLCSVSPPRVIVPLLFITSCLFADWRHRFTGATRDAAR